MFVCQHRTPWCGPEGRDQLTQHPSGALRLESRLLSRDCQTLAAGGHKEAHRFFVAHKEALRMMKYQALITNRDVDKKSIQHNGGCLRSNENSNVMTVWIMITTKTIMMINR